MSMNSRRRSSRANRRAPIRPIKTSNPAGLDPVIEYKSIREDLVRILIVGGALIALMIVLAIVNPF